MLDAIGNAISGLQGLNTAQLCTATTIVLTVSLVAIFAITCRWYRHAHREMRLSDEKFQENMRLVHERHQQKLLEHSKEANAFILTAQRQQIEILRLRLELHKRGGAGPDSGEAA